MGDKSKGLIGKFTVTRNDGKDAPGEKHDGCAYFVLDLTHDPFAIPAIETYAYHAEKGGYHELARHLRTIAAAGDLGKAYAELRIAQNPVSPPSPGAREAAHNAVVQDLCAIYNELLDELGKDATSEARKIVIQNRLDSMQVALKWANDHALAAVQPPSPGVSRADVEALQRFSDYGNGVERDADGHYLHRPTVLALFSPAPAQEGTT